MRHPIVNLIVNLSKQGDELHETVEELLALAVQARELLEEFPNHGGVADMRAWRDSRAAWLQCADKAGVDRTALNVVRSGGGTMFDRGCAR